MIGGSGHTEGPGERGLHKVRGGWGSTRSLKESGSLGARDRRPGRGRVSGALVAKPHYAAPRLCHPDPPQPPTSCLARVSAAATLSLVIPHGAPPPTFTVLPVPDKCRHVQPWPCCCTPLLYARCAMQCSRGRGMSPQRRSEAGLDGLGARLAHARLHCSTGL